MWGTKGQNYHYSGGHGDYASVGGGSSYMDGVSNGQTLSGNQSMPNPNGETMVGNTGHGKATISYIGK